MKKDPVIYFAPLQEFTNFVYRRTHAKCIGGVDKYYAPYISRQNDGTIKKSHLKDIDPKKNTDYDLVPQILAGNPEDFVFLAKVLSDSGYQEVNWNLGCPYPMVTNKGQGSGLLPFPEKVEQILSESLPQLTCRISAKLRLGLYAPEEIFSVVEVLNQFPIEEIILHPRIGKQLYKGKADPELFSQTAELIKHPLLYNGDILTPEDYFRLESMFEDNLGWMIGRGLLQDPFLAKRIKTNLPILERAKILSEFHSIIFYEYSRLLSGKSHLLMRMLKFWSYFCYSFPDPHKTLKRIKKASTIEKYESAVKENFSILNNYEENKCSEDSGSAKNSL